MKKCLIIMVFALLLTGCSGDVSDDQKKTTETESENKVEALKSSAEIWEELKDVALPFIDNGEYGLMNIDGKKVFVTDEDQIKPTFDDKYYIAGSEIRNIDGTPVVNPGYVDRIFYLGQGIFVQEVEKDTLLGNERYSVQVFSADKEGYIDLPFRNIKKYNIFQNDIAMVKGQNINDYQVFYIGGDGKAISETAYRDGSSFNSNGEALVLTEGDEYIYINKNGEKTRETDYTAADFSIQYSCPGTDYIVISEWPSSHINNGKEQSQDSGKYGLFNTVTGETTGLYDIITDLDDTNSFANVFMEDEGWGIMDISTEEMLLECRYDNPIRVHNGLACVTLNGMTGCINSKKEEVVPLDFINNIYFNNRGMWTVGEKLVEITEVELISRYVLLEIDSKGNCVESEIPGVGENDELRANLFNDSSKNCVIEVCFDSNEDQDHDIDRNRYINPWTGETVIELAE